MGIGVCEMATDATSEATGAGFAGSLPRVSFADRDLFFQDSQVVAARGALPTRWRLVGLRAEQTGEEADGAAVDVRVVAAVKRFRAEG